MNEAISPRLKPFGPSSIRRTKPPRIVSASGSVATGPGPAGPIGTGGGLAVLRPDRARGNELPSSASSSPEPVSQAVSRLIRPCQPTAKRSLAVAAATEFVTSPGSTSS